MEGGDQSSAASSAQSGNYFGYAYPVDTTFNTSTLIAVGLFFFFGIVALLIALRKS